jgi:DNA-binding response OmpR family regulator
VNDTTLAEPATPEAGAVHRLLLTAHDSRVLGWLEPSLQALDVDVLVAASGVELERTLFHGGPFDLVVASAQVAGPSGLQVLAKARTQGIRTPFIIIMSFHGDHVRVMVSDVSSATLSSRMVDVQNFVALAMSFVRPSRPSPVPPSSPPSERSRDSQSPASTSRRRGPTSAR